MAYNRCTNWTIDCHLFVCRAMSSSQTIRLLCSTMVDNQSVHPTSIPLHLPFPIYQPTQILHPATPFISPYPLSTWPTLPPQCCRSGSLSLSQSIKLHFSFCELQGKTLPEDLVLRHWLLANCVWRRSSRGDWDLSSEMLGISLLNATGRRLHHSLLLS
jgi:hypothetical protein